MKKRYAASACLAAVILWMPLLAQSGKLADADFQKLAQSHASADEHKRLAAHYAAHAAEHEADAKIHDDLARQYDKAENALAKEARHYAGHSREAAEALRNIAKIHQDLAREHGGK